MLRTRLRPRHWVPAALCVLSLGLAACGDESSDTGNSGDTDNSGVERADKVVRDLREPVTFRSPGDAFDASAARGKTVYRLVGDESIEFVRDVSRGATEALEELGVKVVLRETKFEPSRVDQFIREAVSRKADAIMLQSTPSKLVEAPLSAAKRAGIPVLIEFEHTDPALPTAVEADRGVSAHLAYCLTCVARGQVAAAVSDSKGKVNGVAFYSSGIGAQAGERKVMEQELPKMCSECSLSFRDIPTAAEWPTKIPGLTQSVLSDPKVNYLLPVADAMALFMMPAIQARGAADRVKISTFNASSSVMPLVAKGEVVEFDIGSPNVWTGWAAADQILRLLTDNKPVEDPKIPVRLFDKTNIKSIDLKAAQETWFGSADFRAEYKKLWGVQ